MIFGLEVEDQGVGKVVEYFVKRVEGIVNPELFLLRSYFEVFRLDLYLVFFVDSFQTLRLHSFLRSVVNLIQLRVERQRKSFSRLNCDTVIGLLIL